MEAFFTELIYPFVMSLAFAVFSFGVIFLGTLLSLERTSTNMQTEGDDKQ